MAQRTLADLKNLLQHSLGGGTPSSLLDQTAIINEAGNHLVAMRPWKWLERPPTTLNFTASQAYVVLPTDFRSAGSIVPDDGLDKQFRWVTFHELNTLRQLNTEPEFVYHAAIVQPGQTGVTADLGAPRLELWPTPAANQTPALHLWYTAGWTKLSSDTDKPNMPEWMESLLIALTRAFAQGYDEQDTGSVSARLSEIETGALFLHAVERDADQQPSYGRLRGGHRGRCITPITWNTVEVS